MPIENERKFILDLSIDRLTDICKEFNGKEQEIEQSYIKDGRIRKITLFKRGIGVVITYEHIFTWKYSLKDGTLIEIETDISWNDYRRLFDESKHLISKKRVTFEYDNLHWDLDFLLSDDGKHYMTIAECEMPEGQDAPANLPQFVNDSLIFLVPRNESKKWTNKKLTNSEKAIKMVNSVRSEDA